MVSTLKYPSVLFRSEKDARLKPRGFGHSRPPHHGERETGQRARDRAIEMRRDDDGAADTGSGQRHRAVDHLPEELEGAPETEDDTEPHGPRPDHDYRPASHESVQHPRQADIPVRIGLKQV